MFTALTHHATTAQLDERVRRASAHRLAKAALSLAKLSPRSV
jgi:hypothetical protein